MMRYLILAGAMVFMTFAATTVDARERLRVNDVHNYIATLNSAINNTHSVNGRSQLENLISNQATFEDNVNSYNYNRTHWVNNYYNHNYYGYRYPYHHGYNNAYQGYNNVGYRSLNKWEQISKIETKKRTVPGYRATFALSNITISPLADSAVVDVDFKEQSLNYAPGTYRAGYYAPYYHHQYTNLNTNSKCKMYLGKMDNVVYLTRMYCNTNTNLPY